MRHRECQVLVADGDLASAAALSRDLAGAGFHVVTVTSGADVVQQCVFQPPDVLIMDVDLPDMDGFDVCSYVRSQCADVPVTVILLSDAGDEMTRTSLGQMVDFVGGDLFFIKPCEGRLVVDALDEFVAETPARSTAGMKSAIRPPSTRPMPG